MINIFPVPARNMLNIILNAPVAGHLDFHIADVSGNNQIIEQRQLCPGLNTIQFNIYKLPVGLYSLMITGEKDEQVYFFKFIRE